MIFRILFSILLLVSADVHADIRRTVENVVTIDSLNTPYATMAIPSTTNIYSKSVSLVNQDIQQSVGVMYKATSSGAVNLSIQTERSYSPPSTEGQSNATYVIWNAPFTTTDTAWHMATLDTVIVPYARFHVTGSGSNDASTTLQIKVEKQ